MARGPVRHQSPNYLACRFPELPSKTTCDMTPGSILLGILEQGNLEIDDEGFDGPASSRRRDFGMVSRAGKRAVARPFASFRVTKPPRKSQRTENKQDRVVVIPLLELVRTPEFQ